jgi:hypothetical protein
MAVAAVSHRKSEKNKRKLKDPGFPLENIIYESKLGIPGIFGLTTYINSRLGTYVCTGSPGIFGLTK